MTQAEIHNQVSRPTRVTRDPRRPEGLTARRVIDAAAQTGGFGPRDMGPKGSRRRDVVDARHLGWWACRQLLPRMSYPTLARIAGGYDHSSVIHGVQRHEARMSADTELREQSEALVRSLKAERTQPTLNLSWRYRMTIPFTADVIARAIVAAARSYGDDSVRSFTGRGSRQRRSLTAAAAAVYIVTGVQKYRVSRAMGLGLTSIINAESKASAGFLKAKTAALAAIGGATAVLAPETVQKPRPQRPDAETVSGLPDALLAPRATRSIELDVVSVVAPNLIAGEQQVAQPPAVLTSHLRRTPVIPSVAPTRSQAPSPKLFDRLAPDPQPPVPTRAQISDADRALIDEAIAAGKVRTVVPDGTTELVWDATRRVEVRKPISDPSPATGWRAKKTLKSGGARVGTMTTGRPVIP